jgi:hypothetical protein
LPGRTTWMRQTSPLTQSQNTDGLQQLNGGRPRSHATTASAREGSPRGTRTEGSARRPADGPNQPR